MSRGIESPYSIEGCARPRQRRAREGCHCGAEEQENANRSYSAWHFAPTDFAGVRVKRVPHLLTIPPTLPNARVFLLYTNIAYNHRPIHPAPITLPAHP